MKNGEDALKNAVDILSCQIENEGKKPKFLEGLYSIQKKRKKKRGKFKKKKKKLFPNVIIVSRILLAFKKFLQVIF